MFEFQVSTSHAGCRLAFLLETKAKACATLCRRAARGLIKVYDRTENKASLGVRAPSLSWLTAVQGQGFYTCGHQFHFNLSVFRKHEPMPKLQSSLAELAMFRLYPTAS